MRYLAADFHGPCNRSSVTSSTSFPPLQVKASAFVRNTIVGWGSTVGQWARTDATTVLAEDVTIKDGVCVVGARVLPHKSIKEDLYSPTVVL